MGVLIILLVVLYLPLSVIVKLTKPYLGGKRSGRRRFRISGAILIAAFNH